jgi:hypothetical protein
MVVAVCSKLYPSAFMASGVAVMLRTIEPNPIAELNVATGSAGLRKYSLHAESFEQYLPSAQLLRSFFNSSSESGVGGGGAALGNPGIIRMRIR